jgi:hypothetical protein
MFPLASILYSIALVSSGARCRMLLAKLGIELLTTNLSHTSRDIGIA